MNLTELITPRFSMMARRKTGEYELGFARLPDEEAYFDSEGNTQDLKISSIWYEPEFMDNKLGYRPREIQLPHQKNFIVGIDKDYSKIRDKKDVVVVDYSPLHDDCEDIRREFIMTKKEMDDMLTEAKYDTAPLIKIIRAKGREQTGNRRKILRALVDARQAIAEAREADGYEMLPYDFQEALTHTIDEPIGKLSEQIYFKTFDINKKRLRMALKNYAYVRGIGQDIDWKSVA